MGAVDAGLRSLLLEKESINMTTADNTVPLSGDARQGLLARHPLVFYFLIAYVAHGSWRCQSLSPKLVLASCHLLFLDLC
jgi:hypothetical protein